MTGSSLAWEALTEEELNRDGIIRCNDAVSQMSPDSVTYLLFSVDLCMIPDVQLQVQCQYISHSMQCFGLTPRYEGTTVPEYPGTS